MQFSPKGLNEVNMHERAERWANRGACAVDSSYTRSSRVTYNSGRAISEPANLITVEQPIASGDEY